MTALNLAVTICLITTASLSKCTHACTTPEGAKGECVEIRQCKPIMKQMYSYANTNTSPPAHVLDTLRKSRCNIGMGLIKACCPSASDSTPKSKGEFPLDKSSQNKSDCTLLDGSRGNCVEIRECSPVMKLLEPYAKTNTTPPNHVYDYVRKIRCDFGTGSIRVCCASIPVNLQSVKPTTSKPEDLTRLDNPEEDQGVLKPDELVQLDNPEENNGNNVCTTPDGSQGSCLEIRECSPVMKLLESYTNTNTTPPNHVYDYLRNIRCDFVTGSVRVCCASIPVNLQSVNPTTSKPEDRTRVDNPEEDQGVLKPDLLVQLDNPEENNGNNVCTIPDGSQGSCLEIRECSPVMKLLESYTNTNTTPPNHVYDYLRNIRCDFVTGSVRVCCASIPVNLQTVNPITSKPEDLTRLDNPEEDQGVLKPDELVQLDNPEENNGNNVCTTADGSQGSCLEIRECSPVMKLLESYTNTNTTPPNHVYDYLRNIRCDFVTGSVRVCCASIPVNLQTVNPTTSKPEDRTRLDNPEEDQGVLKPDELVQLYNPEENNGNNVCTTPDGSQGSCLEIRECSPVMKLLESYTNTNTTPPNHVYDYLRNIRCNFVTGSVRVCCASIPINLNPVKPTTLKPDDLMKLNKLEQYQSKPEAQLDNSGDNKVNNVSKSEELRLDNPAETKDVCITPGGAQAKCVGIHECKPVINLLRPYLHSSTTIPNNVKTYLRKARCNIGLSPVNVCCPTNLDSIKQETPKPEELLPLDKCGKNSDGDKVAFGNKTALFDYPWMAQLAYLTNKGIEYLCGGTLISDRYVLTAAHCIPRNRKQKLLYVRLGEHNMSSPIDCTKPIFGFSQCAAAPQDIPIESEVPHPNFNYLELSNDIALLRLKTEANTSEDTVTPICLPVLPNVRNVNLSSLIVTGWGLTENKTRSDVLLQGRVSIMDKQSCKNFYTNINVTDVQICVEDKNGIGSCQGDSGGPLQSMQNFNGNDRYVQYGVVSVGPQWCGAQGLPGIHTKIEYYLDWILNNIKP